MHIRRNRGTLRTNAPRRERPSDHRAAEKSDELPALHSISLVNADQSFCDDVSHGRPSRPAQLQDASNC
jgi:hypothetical protein